MNPRFIQLAICLAIAALLDAGPALAQQKIEIYKGGEKSGASTKNVLPGTITSSRKDQSQPSDTQPATEPGEAEAESNDPLYSEESTQRIRTNGSQLAERSFDSFNRGLMPLHDHLDQLQLVASSELRLKLPWLRGICRGFERSSGRSADSTSRTRPATGRTCSSRRQ